MKKYFWPLTLFGLTLLCACVMTGRALAGHGRIAPSSHENSFSSQAGISGNYNVTGTNEDGAAYEGKLQIIKHGSVYQFRWLAGNQYDGVGIISGNTVAVAYAYGADGSGCGVVSYRTLPNGTLDGVWGMWGVNQSGTERAVRVSGSGIAGNYNATGTNPNGTVYKATLSIAPQGAGYQFQWSTGSSGFGVKQGNTLSVGFGGSKCAWVAYEMKPGGVLDGIWGGYGSSRTGTERAVKQ